MPLAWSHTLFTLPLVLKLKGFDLTLLVLVLLKIERQLSNDTIAISQPALYNSARKNPNLFSNLLKILSLIKLKNVNIFPILTVLVISDISLHLSLLYFNQMAPQLSLFSLEMNSLLKPLLPTLL